MVSAHTKDRVRGVPCDHNPEEERRVKQRVRRDVEPPEVRGFLRQELLKKVGHSWWNRPGRAGADAIAPVRRGGTPRPGATRGGAAPTGVEFRSARRQDDAGRAGRIPSHVAAPHPGPGHSCRRKHGRVPEDEGGTAGSGDP